MRTMHMTVTGDAVTLDSAVAGVRGSGNVDKIILRFDEAWDGFAKTATWWDSHGEKAGEPRVLTADMMVDWKGGDRGYILLVPGEALRWAGTCTLVIDGWRDGALARTMRQEFQVVPAPDSAKGAAMTPTQAQQLQGQVEALLGDMSALASNSVDARDKAVEAQAEAEQARGEARAAAGEAERQRELAAAERADAQRAGDRAEQAQAAAEKAAGRGPYVGENGNWFVWDGAKGAYVDTLVAAQGPVGPKGERGMTGARGLEGPQGPKGDPGDDGVLLEMDTGVFAMAVSEEGHLLLAVNEGQTPPPLEINPQTGHLVYKIAN